MKSDKAKEKAVTDKAVKFVAEKKIAVMKAAWQVYQKNFAKYGLAFGKACCELRDTYSAAGYIGKGFVQVCTTLKIPRRTAYWWIERYEVSAGLRQEPSITQCFSAKRQDGIKKPVPGIKTDNVKAVDDVKEKLREAKNEVASLKMRLKSTDSSFNTLKTNWSNAAGNLKSLQTAMDSIGAKPVPDPRLAHTRLMLNQLFDTLNDEQLMDILVYARQNYCGQPETAPFTGTPKPAEKADAAHA
jgi:hypothetical protein